MNIAMMQLEDSLHLQKTINTQKEVISKLRLKIGDLKHELNFLCGGPQELNAVSKGRSKEFEMEQLQLKQLRKIKSAG
jgi:hypothetical protein